MITVIQRYYDGFIKDEHLLEAINDAIEEWHTSKEAIDFPLYTFLGMCWPEYELFVRCPSAFIKQMHYQSYHPVSWGITD